MSTIKAAVIPSPGAPVEVREIPEPELEPGGALLQVGLSEVCGTDVHLQAGRLEETPFPFIPGHVQGQNDRQDPQHADGRCVRVGFRRARVLSHDRTD